MQTENSFTGELKHFYQTGGMAVKLIFINILVFLGISILEVIARLLGTSSQLFISNLVVNTFTFHTDISEFITHPWGLITSIFTHFSFWHLLWNMLFLYTAGRLFLTYFDQRRLLYTYILGGIFGGLLEIIAHLVFPGIADQSNVVVGASGSVMAIMVAVAFYAPKLEVAVFGIFKLRFIFIVLAFILQDIFSLGLNDNVAHFAHIGGAILGLISIQNMYSSSNIISITHRLDDRLRKFFAVIFSPRNAAKMKVKKGGTTRSTQFKSDEDFNLEAKQRQERTDAILDKISRSGYDSLTKEEKNFLFNQSSK